MANVQKYTSSESGGLCRHYERYMDEYGNYLRFGNQDIDTSKTYLNYNLAPVREISQYQYIKQRCSEVDFVGRKNTNVMCSWVVTAPRELDESEYKKFFSESYRFLSKRYGDGVGRNVISAYVHMDETTPHLHYAFVPVVFDEVRGREKVSAKEVITKRDLQTFHKDFDRHMTLVFGRSIGVHTGITDGENLNKAQLELKRLEEERAKLEAENERLQLDAFRAQNLTFELREVVNDLEEKEGVLRGQIDALQGQLKMLGQSVDSIRVEYETKKGYLATVKKASDISVMYPDYAVVSTKGLGKNKRKYVTVPAKKWEQKHVGANEVGYVEQMRASLERSINEFYKSQSGEQYLALVAELNVLRRNKGDLEQEVARLRAKLNEKTLDHDNLKNNLVDTMNSIPRDVAEVFNTRYQEVKVDRELERVKRIEVALGKVRPDVNPVKPKVGDRGISR